MASPGKILVIRNDKLGDFMLAWPAFNVLKSSFPEAEITALVPGYTQPIAALCPWIDRIIIDDQHASTLADAKHLSALLKQQKFDAAIFLFSDFRTAMAAWLARIPIRVAPATKLAQIFINHKLVQRRSQSLKPEFEYNIDLADFLVRVFRREPAKVQKPPYLSFDNSEIRSTRQAFCAQGNIATDSKLIIVHPGHGGSAANLSLTQYAELIKKIEAPGIHFVITAGPGEITVAEQLSNLIKDVAHSLYHSTAGLVEFAKFISACDLFISGSTGPLHVAGALNKATAAFYPTRKSATSLRWQTLNNEHQRLAFSPPDDSHDLSTLNIVEAAQSISKMLLQRELTT